MSMPRWALCLGLLLLCGSVQAASLSVAVASNFLAPLKAVANAYEAAGGAPLQITPGATGHHYAQIINGAPYDVFLAADQVRPQRLMAAGFAVAGSQFTYAQGRLILWSHTAAQLPTKGLSGLAQQSPRRLAIANPRLAPYGVAAQQALMATDQWRALSPVVVRAHNVAQAFQYVVTGNVTHALVAASFAAISSPGQGQWMLVDANLHEPIRQDAVRLKNARNPDEAKAFLAFLRGPKAATVLEQFGYDTGTRTP